MAQQYEISFLIHGHKNTLNIIIKAPDLSGALFALSMRLRQPHIVLSVVEVVVTDSGELITAKEVINACNDGTNYESSLNDYARTRVNKSINRWLFIILFSLLLSIFLIIQSI